jgi:hypothetical protein
MDKKFVLAEGESFLREYVLPNKHSRRVTSMTFTDKRLVMQTELRNNFYRKEINIADVNAVTSGYGYDRFYAFSKKAVTAGLVFLILGILIMLVGIPFIIIQFIPVWNWVIAITGFLLLLLGIMLRRKPMQRIAMISVTSKTSLSPLFAIGIKGSETDYFKQNEDSIVFSPDGNTLKLINEIGAMLINIQSGRAIDAIL